jgi:hypothetical protein
MAARKTTQATPTGQQYDAPASAPESSNNAGRDNASAPGVQRGPMTAEQLFRRYMEHGPNRRYVEYANLISTVSGAMARGATPASAINTVGSGSLNSGSVATGSLPRRTRTTWQFVDDAVFGRGGFADGSYLDPFELEIENGKVDPKLINRMWMSRYKNFAGPVCNAPWSMIATNKDLIRRTSDFPEVEEFWKNVDGNGTHIMDFMRRPHRQARKHGTGFVCVDRPKIAPSNAAGVVTALDNADPNNRPYAYSIQHENVVDWRVSKNGKILAMIILEADEYAEAGDAPNIRVWTLTEWQLWKPIDPTKGRAMTNYAVADSGPNEIGEVPIVPLWNEVPEEDGELYGHSEMWQVALAAKDHFNVTSEKREVMRKCGVLFVMPYDDKKEDGGGDLVVGSDNVLRYPASAAAGQMGWIAPDLEVVDKHTDEQKALVEDGYDMAGMRALVADQKTSSGYHTEMELLKAEHTVSDHASQLEFAEMRITRLVCLYLGLAPRNANGVRDEGVITTGVQITYPTNFGIRDEERLIQRTTDLLDLSLGEVCNREFIETLVRGLYARKDDDEIQAMVDDAVKTQKISADNAARLQQMVAKVKQSQDKQFPPGAPDTTDNTEIPSGNR